MSEATTPKHHSSDSFSEEEESIIHTLTDPDAYQSEHSLAVGYCVSHPSILLGWRVKVRGVGEGVIVDVNRHLGQSTGYLMMLDGSENPQEVILNRKGRLPGPKYKDFKLIRKEF